MYEPLFNQVLVEIDDKDARWGRGNNDSFGGEVFREGKLLKTGPLLDTADHPGVIGLLVTATGSFLDNLVNKQVMWNEGHEAGKVFEHEGKRYAFVYWWDLVGLKDNKEI